MIETPFLGETCRAGRQVRDIYSNRNMENVCLHNQS